MDIIAVDDEQLSLALLKDAIQKAAPGEKLSCFSVPDKALQYAEKHSVDVAFLDVEMAGMSGLELARELIALYPRINVIFVTGFDDYMNDAFKIYASGYVKKPVRVQRVQKELSHLRYQLPDSGGNHLFIGPFEFDHQSFRVSCDGQDLLLMPREYALFRLLADNLGTFFSPEELYRQAWGQSSNKDVRTIYAHMSRLRKKLKANGENGVEIEQKRGKGYRLLVTDDD